MPGGSGPLPTLRSHSGASGGENVQGTSPSRENHQRETQREIPLVMQMPPSSLLPLPRVPMEPTLYNDSFSSLGTHLYASSLETLDPLIQPLQPVQPPQALHPLYPSLSQSFSQVYHSPRSLFLANGPSFGNFPANVQWAPQSGFFQPLMYQYPLGMQAHLGSVPELDMHQALAMQVAMNRKEWFDHLFALAHQKYNAQDFTSAHQMLQDLHRMDATHLPTLLLLGCTCYSLKLFNLSIFYNNMILSIDPQFSEAYSNLGTTHRAIAQLASLESNVHTVLPSGLQTPQNQITVYHLNLAEHFYRTAMVIRPKYWDATVNLAGLLSAQGRWDQALECYERLEALFEADVHETERTPLLVVTEPPLNQDPILIQTLQDLEFKRRSSPFAMSYDQQGYTKERRRDMAFAKGNLFLAMNNVPYAKAEYVKGLVATGIDLFTIFMKASNVHTLPLCPVTVQEALLTFQKVEQRLLDYTYHTVTSSLLQTLAKIYQDSGALNVAVELYYLSLKIYATPNTCNNLGIILAHQRLDESIQWYELGLSLDPKHVHLYTNLGSALKDRGRIQEGIASYQRAIALQPDFYIALANLANVLKDIGRVDEALQLYRRALIVKPDFVEAFCNFVNSCLFICDWTDRLKNLDVLKGVVQRQLQEGALVNPPLVPTVLPFHTFTYSNLDAWMIREISRRNADRSLWNVLTSDWFPGFPTRPKKLSANQRTQSNECARSLMYPYPYPLPQRPAPQIRIGYVSSDFNNHPLAHLMQSVFGFHDRSRFKIYSYSLFPSDHSLFRQKIEKESDVFLDVSSWTTKQIVEQIALVDQIHILCNLNGYTKGGRNEIFAARPAPIHISLMGFAGTMGAGTVNDPEHCLDSQVVDDLYFDDIHRRWMDYIVADEVACPQKFVCGEPLDHDEPASAMIPAERGRIVKSSDANRMYTEGVIYMPYTYFVNDHKQGFRETADESLENLFRLPEYQVKTLYSDETFLSLEESVRWRKEQIRRLKMRREVFPTLREDTVIFANFNQLYKMDPEIFATWMNIIKQVKNSILWLLRFPPAGEMNLRRKAIELVGEEVASRLVLTDVAPKHLHIHRGRVADFFLDTPECNAHTTAADILWSGTPIITFPKYDFKMCSRVAGSVSYATGTWGSWPMPSDMPNSFSKHLGAKRLQDPSLLGHLMVVDSYAQYEARAVELASSLSWTWKPLRHDAPPLPSPIHSSLPFYPDTENPSHILVPIGLGARLKQRLFLTRDSMPLFDTRRWVSNIEKGYEIAYQRWEKGMNRIQARNQNELQSRKPSKTSLSSRCIWISEET